MSQLHLVLSKNSQLQLRPPIWRAATKRPCKSRVHPHTRTWDVCASCRHRTPTPSPILNHCTPVVKQIQRHIRFPQEAEEIRFLGLDQEIELLALLRVADNDCGSTLSTHALDALKQFYTERDTHAERFEKLKAGADRSAQSEEPLSMEAFTEDWNESQFWVS